ncbi:MAG TPA: uroporphyrinogen-III C-methyltransferase [Candidatus Tenderia sp.]|nr:uroporphyrinogen-III C-methyltransferase [Candidatus Tenderia sp.]
MDFLPVFLDLKGRNVLVAGGGDIAARKIDLLLRAGANVNVVAPVLCAALQQLNREEKILHLEERYDEQLLLQGITLVIAATDDEEVNREVSEDAQALGLPVNVVDQPQLCTFILPSIIDRSPVTVAISTGGASPVLGRILRAHLESLIPASYGKLAELARRFREPVKQRFATISQRRRFWERMLHGQVAEMVVSGREETAEAALRQALESTEEHQVSRGEVYLVGAGPGDPDLLTFRALRLMQQADVVLYDRLVSPQILDLVRREAERIYVGKKRDYHAVRQEDINQLLIDLAEQGKQVLRLKGGDPFIFGRGGEEIVGLASEGIPFQVVPAVTAAAGCASYAGIPLTHRDYAQSVTFVTGQLQDGSVDLEWEALAKPRQTVVVYMGLAGLPVICRQLIAHGVAEDMPAAIVQQGTLPGQKVYVGTLASLPKIVAENEVHAPTLLIIGEVVNLRADLDWYQSGA